MGEILIFQEDDGSTAVDVLLDGDTVWLTAAQMSALFETDNTSIRKHLQNIYEDGELDSGATRANFARVQTEGGRQVTRNVPHFNLDAIISVGYRVNSKRGVKFRQWATKTLNDHLVLGYTVNQRRLAERGVAEAQQTMDLLARTLSRQEGLTDESRQVLDLVTSYAKTWKTLLQYDENALSVSEGTPAIRALDYEAVQHDIKQLKQALMAKGEATALFGQERENALQGILGSIDQTMFGDPLYKSAEEKAANLFYFLIKDHPFSDGNKRIGSFMFLRYMQVQDMPLDISPDTLTALALLVAESEPSNKDLMIRLTMNSIAENRSLTVEQEVAAENHHSNGM
jgi:prophage maintenance system killer protein